MADQFTSFIRSNAIYSKTCGEIHAAVYEETAYLFVNGMPMRHTYFLLYAIEAVGPATKRPVYVTEAMNKDAEVLLKCIGIELGPDRAAHYIGQQIAALLFVKGDTVFKYGSRLNKLLDDIDEKAMALNLFAVSSLDNDVLAD